MKKITTKSFKPKSPPIPKKREHLSGEPAYSSGNTAWAYLPKVSKLDPIEVVTYSHQPLGDYEIEYKEGPLGQLVQTSISADDLFRTREEAQQAIFKREKGTEMGPITETPIIIPEAVKTDPTSPFGPRKKRTPKAHKPEQTLKKFRTLNKFKKITTAEGLYPELCKLADEEKLPIIFPGVMMDKSRSVTDIIALVEHTEDLNSLISALLNKQISQVVHDYGYPSSYDWTLIYMLAEMNIDRDTVLTLLHSKISDELEIELNSKNLMTPIKRLSKKYWTNRVNDIIPELDIQDDFIGRLIKGKTYSENTISEVLRDTTIVEFNKIHSVGILPNSEKLKIGGADGTA